MGCFDAFCSIFRHPTAAKDVPHRGAGDLPFFGQGLDGLTGCGTLPNLLPIDDHGGTAQALALLPCPLDAVPDALPNRNKESSGASIHTA